MKTVDFVFFDAGGGHRAAATALQAIAQAQQRDWNVRLVHLQDILDEVDVFRRYVGIDLQAIYNLMLRKGWTLGSVQGLRFMQQVIRLNHRPAVHLIEKWFRRTGAPDLLVSVVPNFNRAIYEGFRRVSSTSPYVTILTDMADYPPRFWIERQPQYLICGTGRAVEQARAFGHDEAHVLQTSGMIIHPRFYEPMEVDRRAGRTELGLDPKRATGLVLFGGYGSTEIETIVKRLETCGAELQLVVICGKNEPLRRRLEACQSRLPMFVEGFTERVRHYMALSDFFIGKPGPGSLSEALHMGLPVITASNAWTLPQERFNAQWLTDQRYGVVLRSFGEIGPAVRTLLTGQTLAEYRGRVAQVHNRALFEIPEMLESMLAGGV
jgi:hypothetical protein